MKISYLFLLFVSLLAFQPQAWAWNQESSIKKLFAGPVAPLTGVARNTLVFWVNGDADHFVAQSSAPNAESKLYRGDKFEVERIERLAESCESCNVVLLHDQRGTDHWYTASKPWAVWFKVYARGQKILERHVPEIDQTDPKVLSALLSFSQSLFPKSELHLIYRGHSFRMPYESGSQTVSPFDYSNPEHGYDQRVFLKSLKMAGFSKVSGKSLASVSLISCSMASLEFAGKLSPFARYFVASEVDLFEALSASLHFFDALVQVNDSMDARQVSWLISYSLGEAFRGLDPENDGLMEAPSSWMDLRNARLIADQFKVLMDALDKLPEARRSFMHQQIQQMAALTKNPSENYIEFLRKSGKSDEKIALLAGFLKQSSAIPGDLDLGLLLLLIETWDESSELAPLAHWVFERVAEVVHVWNGPGKLGLSVKGS
ncbi:clostripain-related cysteine peptidase [Bdellovibrionota bacterium FG-1]